MREFIFIWSIENISYAWHKTGESLISPAFIAGPIQNSTWTLQLYPRGNMLTDYLSLYLRRGVDNGPREISINFEFYCISAENSQLHSNKFTESDETFINDGSSFGPPCFMRRYEVFFQRRSLYLPGDVLTLCCRMWKHEGTMTEFGQSFGRTILPIERILLVESINLEIADEKVFFVHSKHLNKSLISISMQNCEDSTRVLINPMFVENIKFFELKLLLIEKTLRKILCQHTNTAFREPWREIKRFPMICKALNTGNKDFVQNTIELQIEFVCSTGEETNHIENEAPFSLRSSELVSKYIISCIPSGNISNIPTISEEIWNSYDEHVLCDVELKTQTSFFAHKFVLCARSPVFLAMLTGDMKEKINECIEIDDIEDGILGKFLLFLYTDTFEDLEWDEVISLYYAFDKYQVDRLKILCCSFFQKNISVENVCELLTLADRHHDSDLKKRVESFILQNDEMVFSSSIWGRFIDEQPFLSAKTMVLRYVNGRGEENDAETYDKKLLKLPNVQDDFTAAYQAAIVCDVAIKTTDSTFPTHKFVLCASSTVMKEKFTKDLKNEPTEIFEIADFEDDIVSRLLLFLYTDSLGDVRWDTVTKLYHAADVYQIQRLKIKCSCFLLENLEISNASDLLLLAHKYRDAQLKSVVEDYIFLHDEEIFGSDQWADFSETNLILANETMRMKYRKNWPISHQ